MGELYCISVVEEDKQLELSIPLFIPAKNMDPFAYRDFIDALVVKIAEKEHLS